MARTPRKSSSTSKTGSKTMTAADRRAAKNRSGVKAAGGFSPAAKKFIDAEVAVFTGGNSAKAASKSKSTDAKMEGVLKRAKAAPSKSSTSKSSSPAPMPKKKPTKTATKSSSSGATMKFKGKSDGGVSFQEAFAKARKAGVKTFSWAGKKYTTAVKK